jgi:hypothetical protein
LPRDDKWTLDDAGGWQFVRHGRHALARRVDFPPSHENGDGQEAGRTHPTGVCYGGNTLELVLPLLQGTLECELIACSSSRWATAGGQMQRGNGR